jgi:hypothetical protein
MPQYLIQITHTLLVNAHNRPTAEVLATSATPTPKKTEDIVQVNLVPKVVSQEVI